MILILTIAGVLLVLGILAFIVSRWPDKVAKNRKEKREKPVPVEPPKELVEATERFERRARALESSLQSAQKDKKEDARQIDALKALIDGLQRQVAQEKAWRSKEELVLAKEQKQEEDLRTDLEKTRGELHAESNQRIRLEYEVKELRSAKDSLTADLRKFSGQNNELERRVKDLIEETRNLKSENAKLRYKKESDQWVAKDDHVALEKLLKQARQEVAQLQQRLPVELRAVGNT